MLSRWCPAPLQVCLFLCGLLAHSVAPLRLQDTLWLTAGKLPCLKLCCLVLHFLSLTESLLPVYLTDLSHGSKVRCCKEQYCIGALNVRSMDQGKLEVVKWEMARVNVDILGIRELKWTGG